MRILLWILGVSMKDKKMNEIVRKTLRVACITGKIGEARLRCMVHDRMMRREDESCMRRITTAEASVGDGRREMGSHA